MSKALPAITVHYPSFAQSYPNLYKKGLLRRLPKHLKYRAFTHYHQLAIDNLFNDINQNQLLVQLFNQYYKIAHPIFEGYVLRQFSLKQRLDIIGNDLQFALNHFPEDFFINKEMSLLSINEHLEIRLQLNPLSCLEGLWTMGLFYDNIKVYIFTFTVGHKNKLIMGSIQGASADNERKLIKKTTKAMHGLRPQQLMVWLAIALAKLWQLDVVEAISNQNHPRMNLRKQLRNKQIYQANYDEIWHSYQGEKLNNGNWKIPPLTQKPLEDIASKKRSMYRKRYALFEQLTDALQQNLSKHTTLSNIHTTDQ